MAWISFDGFSLLRWKAAAVRLTDPPRAIRRDAGLTWSVRRVQHRASDLHLRRSPEPRRQLRRQQLVREIALQIEVVAGRSDGETDHAESRRSLLCRDLGDLDLRIGTAVLDRSVRVTADHDGMKDRG